MRFLIRVFLIISILLMQYMVYAHHKPMIDKQYPPAPPIIDPGPDAALVQVHVMDSNHETISATVAVNQGNQEPENDPYQKYSLRKSANRLKGPMQFRPLHYYFYTDGHFDVKVPPGKVTLEIMKGYEYQPRYIQIEAVKKDTVALEIQLEKAIDMESLGWYSGDTHIHMDRTGSNDDTLMTITSAKNIQYAYLLSMNTTGYDQGNMYEGWLQKKGLGDSSVFQKGSWFIVSGQEYRSSILGHVTIIMPDEYIPGLGKSDNIELWPSLGIIADQSHEVNGFIGLAHGGYYNQEADGILLEDKMDFIELLQFGGYRSLGLDGWYDFLNIGFRIPIVGACDFPYTRELGSEITYVWSEERPTPRTFAKRLAEGKSFATTGPMLFFEADGKKPGEMIHLPAGTNTTIDVRINVESPVYPVRYVELIQDGQVMERMQFSELRKNCQFHYSLPVNKSGWVAARTYAEAGTDAHTNPIYIYVGNRLPFKHDAARQIIARLDGSIEAIPNKKITNRLKRLKNELEKMINGKKARLPLPGVGD